MEIFYQLCKSFTDPVLIIFILLLVALVLCYIGNKNKTGIIVLGLAIILMYALSIAPVAHYLAYHLEKDYFRIPAPAGKNIDVIVVLGGGAHDIAAVDGTFASESSAARLLHAVKVFNKYGAKYFVCAGKGTAKLAEGAVMAQTAAALGVPQDKIKIDDKSNNTFEHAVELNKMFKDKSIYVGIVTSGYHMKRSEKEFKKYFKNIIVLPASYSYSSPDEKDVLKYIPQTAALNSTATSLREFIGALWYEIKDI